MWTLVVYAECVCCRGGPDVCCGRSLFILSVCVVEAAPTSVVRVVDDPEPDLADEIEHVKAIILDRLDALSALRTEVKDNCVPLTVCTHLEQCTKETEVTVHLTLGLSPICCHIYQSVVLFILSTCLLSYLPGFRFTCVQSFRYDPTLILLFLKECQVYTKHFI